MDEQKQQDASEGIVGQSASTGGLERKRFELWFSDKRGTTLRLEHPQAFDSWCAGKEEERADCAALCRRMAAHAKENAASLRQYKGVEQGARCWELASSYLEEAAFLMDARSNDRVEGRDACGASLSHAGLAGNVTTKKGL